MLDCDKVAAHVAATLETDRPQARVTPAAVHDMVTTRCRTDAWSDETKQCLHAIKTIREGRACATSMTDEQREAIQTQARSLRTADTASTEEEPSADWIRHVIGEPDAVPH